MKFEFDTLKPTNVSRVFITALIFLGLFQMYGWAAREAQQVFLVCGTICMVSLFMKNIWLTLFMMWTVFLYCYSHFQLGQIYLTNIFFGSVLYIFSMISFKKEHIDKYLTVFLWFVAANIGFSVIQTLGGDWIYKMAMFTKENGFEGTIDSNDPCGFMMFRSAYGMLAAMAMPVIMTRRWKTSLWLGLAMFVPIYISSSSVAVLAGIVAFLFSLWHAPYLLGRVSRYKRLVVVGMAVVLLVGGLWYAAIRDDHVTSFNARVNQWKLVLGDTVTHPLVGWGLDSYRVVTKDKTWLYAKDPYMTKDNKLSADIWDNPHNAFVSFVFEWGYIGLFFVVGYIASVFKRFKKANPTSNAIALFGVFLVTVILSLAHFPLFLARMMCMIVPMMALFEIETERYA